MHCHNTLAAKVSSTAADHRPLCSFGNCRAFLLWCIVEDDRRFRGDHSALRAYPRRQTLRPIIPLLIGLLLLSCAAWASQSPGHVYVALKAYEQAPPAVRAIIDSNRASYIAGATGPDIALTTYLIAEGLGYQHPGSEAHYQATGQIINNMLKRAAADPNEASRNKGIAFALGWLTHYCTDGVVHPLVNQFGGYFGAGGDFIVRHKHLELVECEHVFQKGFGNLDEYAISAGAVPTELVTAAFNDTFPNNIVYRPITQYTALAFNDDLIRSSALMAGASGWLLNCHRQGWSVAGPVFSTVLKGYPPNPDEYKALMQPLTIEEVKMLEPDATGQARLSITYNINDLGLYNLFCREWDQRIGSAVSQATGFFNTYAGSPASLNVPDLNLDTGMAIGAHFDASTAWPGKPDIYSLLAFIEITDADGKEVYAGDKTGQWMPIPFMNPGVGSPNAGTIEERPGWNGGKAGKCFISVPFDASKGGEYNAKVRLAMANKTDKRLFGWPERNMTVESNWAGPISGQPELSILFLVDCSGSMGGSKIKSAIAAVKTSVDQTNDKKTEWCLVRFGGCSVNAVCRFTMDPNKIKAAADTLSDGGDTPLTYGREKALTYLTTRGRGKTGRMVILCDGQDNCPEHGGISQPEAAAQLMKLMRTVQPAQMPAQGGR